MTRSSAWSRHEWAGKHPSVAVLEPVLVQLTLLDGRSFLLYQQVPMLRMNCTVLDRFVLFRL